jgi:carboxyl-terminal processing protease
VELRSIEYQLLPGGIGYIRIINFRENTANRIYAALEQFNRFETLALILDLRSNPGGSLGAAFGVAGHFLAPGSIFISQEEQGGPLEMLTVAADPDNPVLGEPDLVVLINERTVGEAEAVAAALQDAGRAVIIGTTSFGKGSSNAFVDLSDGSAIYLPTSQWFRSTGQRITGVGVEPDIVVTGEQEQTARAYDYVDELLPAFR